MIFDILSGIGSLVSAGAGIADTYFNQQGFKDQMAFQQAESARNQANFERNFEEQQYLARNSYSIRMADMEKAGWNPYLAAAGNALGGSPVSSTTTSAPSAPRSNLSAAAANVVQSLRQSLEARRVESEIDLNKDLGVKAEKEGNAAEKNAESNAKQAEAATINAQSGQTNAQSGAKQAEAATINAQSGATRVQNEYEVALGKLSQAASELMEISRSNKAKESLGAGQLQETIRHNINLEGVEWSKESRAMTNDQINNALTQARTALAQEQLNVSKLMAPLDFAKKMVETLHIGGSMAQDILHMLGKDVSAIDQALKFLDSQLVGARISKVELENRILEEELRKLVDSPYSPGDRRNVDIDKLLDQTGIRPGMLRTALKNQLIYQNFGR